MKDFEDWKSASQPVFFDRGFPDLVHYAIRFGVELTEFNALSQAKLYNSKVFIFAPWREIFVNDQVRRMTFEASIEIDDLLQKTYREFGYHLVEVPRGSLEDRAQFIIGETKAREK